MHTVETRVRVLFEFYWINNKIVIEIGKNLRKSIQREEGGIIPSEIFEKVVFPVF